MTYNPQNQIKNGRPPHCHRRLLLETRDKEIYGFLGKETLNGPRSAAASCISICYEHNGRCCSPPVQSCLSFIRMAVIQRCFKQHYLSPGHIYEYPDFDPNCRIDQRIYTHAALQMRLSRTPRTSRRINR